MTTEFNSGLQVIMTTALVIGFIASFCCATITVSLLHLPSYDKNYRNYWIFGTLTYAVSIMSAIILVGGTVVMLLQYAGQVLVMLAGK